MTIDPCLDGIVGGGVVDLGSRQATAVLSATTEKNGKASGLLRWVDPDHAGSELLLESSALSGYGPVPGHESTRQASGQVFANGAGPYPFVVRVFEAGTDGQDTVTLAVGDAIEGLSETGFSYEAEGPLVAGDLVGTWIPRAQ